MMEMEGWKPPHAGVESAGYRESCQGHLLSSEEQIKMGARRFLISTSFRGAQANYGAQIAHLRISRFPGPSPSDHTGMNERGIEAQMTKLTAKAAGTFADCARRRFHDDGRIDEKSIEPAEPTSMPEVGCDGVHRAWGFLGEAPKLDANEAEAGLRSASSSAREKHMQIIVGIFRAGLCHHAVAGESRRLDAGPPAGVNDRARRRTCANRRPDYWLFSSRRRKAVGDGHSPGLLQDYPVDP